MLNIRISNIYGKCPEERAEVIDSYENVLPLLEKSSDIIIGITHKHHTSVGIVATVKK